MSKVTVVGLGVTGAAVAKVLLDRSVEVHVSDIESTPELLDRAEPLIRMGAEVVLGRHDSLDLDWADLVIPSKGVPPSNPILALAVQRGIRVWSEFELAFRMITDHKSSRIAAITGTNGKTTTTTLLHRILEASGMNTTAAGNLPTPLVEAVQAGGDQARTYVCEASSFGLAFIESFRAEVAVVLNVADDHYDWHKDYSDYLAAKARITENQTEDDLLVVKADDLGCTEIAASSRARIAVFGPDSLTRVRELARRGIGGDIVAIGGIEGEELVVESGQGVTKLASLRNIRLSGRHNLDNVLGACIAALELGAKVEKIIEISTQFDPLPHRMSLVAERGGVRFIDDSKSTNPHSTLRAVEGLKGVILIAGGRAKGIDLSALESVKGLLAGLVVMGEAADELEAVLVGPPTARARDVEEAVTLAVQMARPGNIILLSPACSSLDQYSSYAERGDRFAKAVLGR